MSYVFGDKGSGAFSAEAVSQLARHEFAPYFAEKNEQKSQFHAINPSGKMPRCATRKAI
jgi:hypothetical protein